MTRLSVALLSLLMLATVSGAQEKTQHPIDKALEACIDKNGSTAGMVECTDKAYHCVGQRAEQELRRTDAGSETRPEGSVKVGAACMDQISRFGFQINRQYLRYDARHDVHSDAR